MFGDERARKAFKSFNFFKISKDGDATVLDNIFPDAFVVTNVDILERGLFLNMGMV